jgi:hypothetical protein
VNKFDQAEFLDFFIYSISDICSNVIFPNELEKSLIEIDQRLFVFNINLHLSQVPSLDFAGLLSQMIH